jgi:hypothetical protein
MTSKILEIRDSMTFIPALAVKMVADNPTQHFYLHRTGYATATEPIIVLMRLSDHKAASDPYGWPTLIGSTRTMMVAHEWIQEHFDHLSDGDVVDVEFILGETAAPKTTERLGNEDGL